MTICTVIFSPNVFYMSGQWSYQVPVCKASRVVDEVPRVSMPASKHAAVVTVFVVADCCFICYAVLLLLPIHHAYGKSTSELHSRERGLLRLQVHENSIKKQCRGDPSSRVY